MDFKTDERIRKMSNNNEALLTVDAMATLLSVTPACIRRWILERKLATIKLGRLVRIPPEEVRRMIENGLRPAKYSSGEEITTK